MTYPFSPVHLPFISGVRQDIGQLAQESPSQLRRAENVVFTKRGHIAGRPGIKSRDAQVERSLVGGGTIGLIAGLANVASGQTPAGIVSTGFPLSPSGTDTPLACWQGEGYFRRDTLWSSTGPMWSLRQTKSAVLKTYDPFNVPRSDPCPIGQNIAVVNTAGAGGSGFPFLNDAGEITSISFGNTTSFGAGYSEANTSAASNASFFIDTASGNVIGYFPATIPNIAAGIFIGTGATTVTTAQQATSALLAPDNFYYVAFTSSTAGRITVLQVNAVGTVTQTLNLNGLGTVQGVSLVHNGLTGNSGRLGLAWKDAAVPALKTKVLTIITGVMADAAIDFTLTGTPMTFVSPDFGALAAGINHLGQMSVTFTTSTADLYIGGRSFTSATETSRTLLVANGAAGLGRSWDPMFGAAVVAGRTLLGVYSSYDLLNPASQWIVLDATKIYNSKTTDRTVAAAGPFLGAARMTPSSAYFTSTSVSFAVAEGLSFSGAERPVPIIRRAGIRRITLSTQGVQAAHINGVTLLSGQLAHVFDGASTRPDHFVEEVPFLTAGTSVMSGGGALPAGSFTYQTSWETVNSRGQIIRSGASNQITLVATAGQKATIVSTIPQLANNVSQLESIRVRLWATQVNPTSASPLYFVTEAVVSTPSVGTPVSLVHNAQATGIEEQLYETSLTLADMRAPGADRGIAVVNERVWVADQDKLYASKIIRPGIAPSWNTEGTNTIQLPSTLGTIQGLASVNTGLVVICSRGGAVVTGPGVDDTGAGPGWQLQIIDGVPGAGTSSPRSVTTTPTGAAFVAQDGDIWLVNSSGQSLPLSRPLRDVASLPTSAVDVVNITPVSGSNAMLVAHGLNGQLRVLDLEMGFWGTWVFPSITPTNGLFLAAINGALWIQTAGGSIVWSVDDPSGPFTAPLEVITAIVETGTQKQAQPVPHGWGRLRSVELNELRLFAANAVTVTMQVLADQNNKELMNKTIITNPTDPDAFPGGSDGGLEFRTSVQRCAYFRAIMTLTPACFEAEGLDFWVANTGEKTPTNNRS